MFFSAGIAPIFLSGIAVPGLAYDWEVYLRRRTKSAPLAFTGHKNLLGPTGIGGSYVAENIPIHATRFGGTGVRSAQRTHPEEFPYFLECGTLTELPPV